LWRDGDHNSPDVHGRALSYAHDACDARGDAPPDERLSRVQLRDAAPEALGRAGVDITIFDGRVIYERK
jgi:hypothetical protein